MSETTSTTSSGTTTSNSRQQQLNSNRSSNQEATSSSAAVTADESSASSATLTAFEFLNEFINRNQPEEGGEMDDFHRFNNNGSSSLFERSSNLFRDNFNTTSILNMSPMPMNSENSGASTSAAATATGMPTTILSLNNTNNPPNDGQQQPMAQEAGAGAAAGGDQAGGGDAPPGNPVNGLFGVFLKSLQTSIPFVFILFAKILHQHLIGFFIVLGFMTTLHFSNKTLLNQIQLKDKKENYKLVLLILFLLANIVIFFIIFGDYKLENCLVFLSPNIPKMDTWNLLWIVVCTDTIIKFMIISLKAQLTLLPFRYLPLRKRGSFYSTVESVGLFYRYVTPVHPWILYLLYSESPNVQLPSIDTSAIGGASAASLLPAAASNADLLSPPHVSPTFFTVFLCILYVIFKINQIYNGLNEVVRSLRELLGNFSYGMPVTISEFDENVCPICQDKFSNPVILKCKHTFCQDCVCMWLDKENSCPMCRAKILVKKPKFKDGSTSAYVQWF